MPDNFEPACTALSRRQMLAASGTGLLAATAVAVPANASTGSTVRNRSKTSGTGNGTPERVHLAWGNDPATSVVVSWTCPDPALRPRLRIGQRVIRARARSYTDEASGETVWAYHARVDRLRPGATYAYAVTADNDRSRADPFSATFTTAPQGRAKFRFTSFGDLAAAGPQLVPAAGAGAATYAAETVESFQPLFHLVNGDSCDTGAAAPGDFGDSVQTSAANRPWMPVPGMSGAGAPSYLTRYTLPDNDVPGFEGHWYSFRIGSVLVVALNGDDVAHQPASDRGYSAGAQTRWLESALAVARQDTSVDWIVVQVHQSACSSSASGPGSDPGIAQQWLPLFDQYEVDLVMSGHNAGYERSFPVRGFDQDGAATGIFRPRPVTTADSGVFDTSQGTVHLVLGSGGARAASGQGAAWSARRDTSSGHGIAVLDVDPGTEADGQTSITVTYYRTTEAGPGNPALESAADLVPGDGAPGDTVPLAEVPLEYEVSGYGIPGDYAEFESFTLIRPRSDKRRWHTRKSPAAVQA
jgi:hypothetical protein